MSIKKKKNVIVLTCCIVTCYILYQLYFFLTLTSESNNALSPVLDLDHINNVQHLRSEDDKYINDHGIIRGVYFADMKHFRPDQNKEFKCRKSHENIAYERVNDDFCDCEDGMDEPSTSACPESVFYCDTQFPRRQSFSVPSGKVNDGICDCCDGSDEWLYGNKKILSQNTPNNKRFYLTKCPNNCHK